MDMSVCPAGESIETSSPNTDVRLEKKNHKRQTLLYLNPAARRVAKVRSL